MAFYSTIELKSFGFKFLGDNVLISKSVSIYGAQYISIDSNTRIDDFVILSSSHEGIEIGKFVHIAPYSSLIGSAKITMDDFSGISSRVSIYSSTDDYSGSAMTNPCVPKEFRNVKSSPVIIGKHVIIGVNSVIMPGVKIGNGSAVGALSLVTKSLPESIIASGIPARRIGDRLNDIYSIEKKLIDSLIVQINE
jgi:acetyltransferase-like isoleucine patch superfamily enzyme